MEQAIAGGILLALFWIAVGTIALRLGMGLIGVIVESALVRWCIVGTLVALYYITHNDLWPTVWTNAYWLWLGPLLAAMVGGAVVLVWESLKKLYAFLQWTEHLWDTFPQWTPFRRTARPWGPPRP